MIDPSACGTAAAGNTRWDDVVPVPGRAPNEAASVPPRLPSAPVAVRVRLFGMRLPPGCANPLHLQFDAGCTLRDVLAAAGARLGQAMLRTIVDERGDARPVCRVFLEGEMTEDMGIWLRAGARAAAVEIILLREIEGG